MNVVSQLEQLVRAYGEHLALLVPSTVGTYNPVAIDSKRLVELGPALVAHANAVLRLAQAQAALPPVVSYSAPEAR